MDFKVIWSDAAIEDLREICSYISRDNPDAALRMGQGIRELQGDLVTSRLAKGPRPAIADSVSPCAYSITMQGCSPVSRTS